MTKVKQILNLTNKRIGHNIRINESPFIDIAPLKTLAIYFRNLCSYEFGACMTPYNYRIFREVPSTKYFTTHDPKNLNETEFIGFIQNYINNRLENEHIDMHPLCDCTSDEELLQIYLGYGCENKFIKRCGDSDWLFIPVKKIPDSKFLTQLYTSENLAKDQQEDPEIPKEEQDIISSENIFEEVELIKNLAHNPNYTAVQNAITIGHKLGELKDQIKQQDREWIPFIRSELGISERTCQKYMKLASTPIVKHYYNLGIDNLDYMISQGTNLSR